MADNNRQCDAFPAYTPENREKQLINRAYNLAEERLINGTASSGEIVHFLKLGSRLAELQIKSKEADIELTKQKTANLAADRASADLIEKALHAFAKYSGNSDD